MENNSALHIKTVITGVIAALTAFWGWFGWLVIAWISCMAIDYATGSCAALRAVASKEGRWSSAKLREGAWHKGGMIVIVCVALVADWLIGMMLANLPGIALPFEYTVLIGPLVIVWYIIGELGSLAEHAVSMGAKVPAWLPKILAAGKSAVDAAGDKIVGEDEHHEEV